MLAVLAVRLDITTVSQGFLAFLPVFRQLVAASGRWPILGVLGVLGEAVVTTIIQVEVAQRVRVLLEV